MTSCTGASRLPSHGSSTIRRTMRSPARRSGSSDGRSGPSPRRCASTVITSGQADNRLRTAFEYGAHTVVVAREPDGWSVQADGRLVRGRLLDVALEELLPAATDRDIALLTVRVLEWEAAQRRR
jgi:hypothetical protein